MRITLRVRKHEKTIRWREGKKGWLRKKFFAIRVFRSLDSKPLTLGWLIGERPARGQQGDWKYYFSNFPEDTSLEIRGELASPFSKGGLRGILTLKSNIVEVI